MHPLSFWSVRPAMKQRAVICPRVRLKKSGLSLRIYGNVDLPTLMGRSNLEAEPSLTHGVAPHMCDESSAALLGGEAGGRSPELPFSHPAAPARVAFSLPVAIRMQRWRALDVPASNSRSAKG
jgi:hypothetical protein